MSEDPSVQIGMIWPDVEDSPVLRANQFISQLNQGPDGTPEELILVIGHITPPVILGTPEEMAAMLGAVGAVAVKTLGRYSISRGQVHQLIDLLQRQAAQWDAAGGTGS